MSSPEWLVPSETQTETTGRGSERTHPRGSPQGGERVAAGPPAGGMSVVQGSGGGFGLNALQLCLGVHPRQTSPQSPVQECSWQLYSNSLRVETTRVSIHCQTCSIRPMNLFTNEGYGTVTSKSLFEVREARRRSPRIVWPHLFELSRKR